jgi:hypothetical protein
VRRLRTLLLLLLLGWGAAALLRLRRTQSRVRVDVYFQDGSVESFGEESPAGASLLARAQDVRRAALA